MKNLGSCSREFDSLHEVTYNPVFKELRHNLRLPVAG